MVHTIYWISIPYGAIKRLNEKSNQSNELDISIPYGAIKSLWHKDYDLHNQLFQFLMVLIKKFFAFENMLLSVILFQFLMVH